MYTHPMKLACGIIANVTHLTVAAIYVDGIQWGSHRTTKVIPSTCKQTTKTSCTKLGKIAHESRKEWIREFVSLKMLWMLWMLPMASWMNYGELHIDQWIYCLLYRIREFSLYTPLPSYRIAKCILTLSCNVRVTGVDLIIMCRRKE